MRTKLTKTTRSVTGPKREPGWLVTLKRRPRSRSNQAFPKK